MAIWQFFFLCIICANSYAHEKIIGAFPQLAGQMVKLEGFDGFNTYLIANAQISKEGHFEFKYSTADYGMGYLTAEDNKPFFLILSGEDIQLRGEAFALPESIEILKGKENQLFEQ